MGVCDQLEPKRVFHYFEEICGIPHGSGNMDEISNYCAEFAKDHQLQYHKDAYGNLILQKKASEGYEGAEPVIIQGHLDMVCEKESGVEIDFAKDGLELYVEGDFLRARGTTLGGDDGIAVAYALALLEDEALPHPPLEVVLTVDEEIGLLGAEKIDLSMLRGRKLLNLDSDEEGIFFVSCAGGLLMECRIPMAWAEKKGKCYEVKVSGLQGGHSGTEIQKERGNAIFLLGRVLEALSKDAPFSIVSMKGGMMDNAIPREASCMILLEGAKTRLPEAIARAEAGIPPFRSRAGTFLRGSWCGYENGIACGFPGKGAVLPADDAMGRAAYERRDRRPGGDFPESGHYGTGGRGFFRMLFYPQQCQQQEI